MVEIDGDEWGGEVKVDGVVDEGRRECKVVGTLLFSFVIAGMDIRGMFAPPRGLLLSLLCI